MGRHTGSYLNSIIAKYLVDYKIQNNLIAFKEKVLPFVELSN